MNEKFLTTFALKTLTYLESLSSPDMMRNVWYFTFSLFIKEINMNENTKNNKVSRINEKGNVHKTSFTGSHI